MGLILNNNVQETKIMSAYGLTVYGKINRYIWTLEGKRLDFNWAIFIYNICHKEFYLYPMLLL